MKRKTMRARRASRGLTRKPRAKRAVEPSVEIVLADGSRVSARGAMADQLGRRLLSQYTYTGWTGWNMPVTYGTATVNATPAYSANSCYESAVTGSKLCADSITTASYGDIAKGTGGSDGSISFTPPNGKVLEGTEAIAAVEQALGAPAEPAQ